MAMGREETTTTTTTTTTVKSLQSSMLEVANRTRGKQLMDGWMDGQCEKQSKRPRGEETMYRDTRARVRKIDRQIDQMDEGEYQETLWWREEIVGKEAAMYISQ